MCFFFSSRRRHTRYIGDWSSDVCSSDLILRPLVTEKGMHRSTRNNQYAFEVHSQCTKDDVRRAVEDLFNVKVDKVRTQNRRGKPRKHKFKAGQTKAWKKAIVTLDSEHRIDVF